MGKAFDADAWTSPIGSCFGEKSPEESPYDEECHVVMMYLKTPSVNVCVALRLESE